MTSLEDSKAMAKIWQRKPSMTKVTSPYEAVMTPKEMAQTIMVSVLDICLRPKANEMSRTATGVKALSIWMKETLKVK